MSSQENTQGQGQSEQDIIAIDSEAENAAQSMLFTRETTQPNEQNNGENIYNFIRQCNATNALTKISSRKTKDARTDPITGDMQIKKSGYIVLCPVELMDCNLTVGTTTFILLDFLTKKLTESGAKTPFITVTLKEYMKYRERKDRDTSYEQVKEDLIILSKIQMKSDTVKDEKHRQKDVPYAFINVADSGVIDENGNITFRFGQTMYEILRSSPIMYMPPQLPTINPKQHPNTYNMGRKIAEHKNMNVGKKNENIISVKTLIENTPYLPTVHEVKETNRHYKERIIDPFERDLDAASDIFTWEYCHSNGNPLTDEELSNFDINIFMSLLIKVTWLYYPDQTERLERKQKRIEQSKRRTASKNKKKEITESGA